jgi:hypothetical protein
MMRTTYFIVTTIISDHTIIDAAARIERRSGALPPVARTVSRMA